jgi:pimeloyl-ACP methyl ester carboxylesterase
VLLHGKRPVVSSRERTVRVAGLSVHVRESGAGNPLLLINGIGAHIGMWGALEQRLGGLRVISFDAPGTGRSQTPLMPLSLDGVAGLAEELLDKLGYEQVDVLGYSFGGIIAQRLARRASAHVRRLVLAATTQQARQVTRPMVEAALREGSMLHHHVALASTAVRMFWPR